jgi:hypothetical protein
MRGSFEKQTETEIAAILSKLLDIPHDSIKTVSLGKQSHPNLVVNADHFTFVVECKSLSNRAQVNLASAELEGYRGSFKKNAIPLVVVPFMGEAGRRFCEEHKLSWIDLSGNAHIKGQGLLIRIEGHPNRFKHVGRPPNVFAPKSSRIARRLLMEPERKFTQRELAQVTHLDEGHTSRIIRRLLENRLILRDKEGFLKAEDPDQLLGSWHDAYDFHKHQVIKGHIAARSGEELLLNTTRILAELEINYATTGLAAAWLYTRFAGFRTATFYFPDPPSRRLFDSLHFREDERGANTWVVAPNDEGVFHGTMEREGIPCVHPVQVYLDLKGHPERASEAASMLCREYLTWKRND